MMCLNIPFITSASGWEGNAPFSGNLFNSFSAQVQAEFAPALKMTLARVNHLPIISGSSDVFTQIISMLCVYWRLLKVIL